MTEAEADAFRPGWIFLHATTSPSCPMTSRPGGRASRPIDLSNLGDPPRGQPSVSDRRITLAAVRAGWSPRGKSIAFGRFVPAIDRAGASRPEGPLRSGDPRRTRSKTGGVVVARLRARPERAGRLSSRSICSWSPDGLYLAIPRPGQQPAIEIVRTDTKKRVHDRERRPAVVVARRLPVRLYPPGQTSAPSSSTSSAWARASASRECSPPRG